MFSSSLMNWAVAFEGRDMAIAVRAKSLDMGLRREALWDVLLLITAPGVCLLSPPKIGKASVISK